MIHWNRNISARMLAAIFLTSVWLIPLSVSAHHKHHHIVVKPVIVKPIHVHKPHKHHKTVVVVRPAKSHGHVWVAGHWRWSGHHQVWIKGHWR